MKKNDLHKLHLGCFDHVVPGWINTDITPHLFIARVPLLATLLFKLGIIQKDRFIQHKNGIFRSIKFLNVTKRFNFSDNSIDHVFCSHILEHLYPSQTEICVKEVYRILKKGGVFRILVPDLDKLIDAYDPEWPEQLLTSLFEAKSKRDKNCHHWHYNERNLALLLKNCGFQKVYRSNYLEGNCPDLLLLDSRPDSLFMEAVK